jgi:hypothetical protein
MMPSFLKSLFGSKRPKKQLCVAESGKMFAWKKGCWLEATETTVFLLPGQLIGDGEKIGSIIETSDDDVLIGFTESLDRKSFTEIRVKLEADQSATIRRSAQAMMLADDQRERKIYISFEADDTSSSGDSSLNS